MQLTLEEYIEASAAFGARTLSTETDIAACLRAVHAAFDALTDQLAIDDSDPSSILASMAHAAFLSALTLAASGQVPSSAMVIRGCIENAMYGFFMHEHPELFDVWSARHKENITRAA